MCQSNFPFCELEVLKFVFKEVISKVLDTADSKNSFAEVSGPAYGGGSGATNNILGLCVSLI
ncbi:hypothetical protein [Winogradskyella ouciana]|uniref:hypothetical protein n=1 Tax=Winogradskyella ouciana TaxID=2608631 RepID=UPI00139030C5|nr:hypothetical protein [Winogradskyella ouciana]